MAKGNVHLEFTGDAYRFEKALAQSNAQIEKLKARLNETGRAGQRSSSQLEVGTKQADKAVAGMVTRYLSLAGAIGTVTTAMRAMHAERERGADLLSESARAYTPLAQLADSPAHYAHLIREAEKSREEMGMSAGQAASLQSALTSMGIDEHRPMFAKLHGVTDPAALAFGAQTVIEAMGREEVGTPIQAANKLFMASKISKTTVDQFAPAATIAAKPFGEIKATDEELLASISVMAKALKSADEAGTQLGALADVIHLQGRGGKGFWEGFAGIHQDLARIMEQAPALERAKIQRQLASAKNKTPEELDALAEQMESDESITAQAIKKYFGRKEARTAFLHMQAVAPEVMGVQQAVEAEGRLPDMQGYVARMAGIVESNPLTATHLAREQARARRDMATEAAFGTEQTRSQATIDNLAAESLRRGEPILDRWIKAAFMRVGHSIYGNPGATMAAERIADMYIQSPGIRQTLNVGNTLMDPFTKEVRNLNRTMEQTRDAVQNLNRKNVNLGGSPDRDR